MKPELDIQDGDVLIALGTQVRAVTRTADTVTVGGYLIPFTDANNKDLYNTFWDDESDLGALRGNGMDVYVHHTYPLSDDPALVELAERKLTPMTTRVDPGVGLWAETVLKLNDEYEAMIAQMVDEERLFWSSGSAGHLVRIDDATGYVRRWPVIEGSLTPTPGTPHHRTQITTLRALRSALTPTPVPEAAAGKTEKPAVVGAGDSGKPGIRAVPLSVSDAAWATYLCCKMCAAICRTAAQMVEDYSLRSTLSSYGSLCANCADNCEDSYYQICWYATSDEMLTQSVAALVAAVTRLCGQLVADCAGMVTDPTMNALLTQSISVCETCASAADTYATAAAEPASTSAVRSISPMASLRSLRALIPAEAIAVFDAEVRLGKAERASAVLSKTNHGMLRDARGLIDTVITTHEAKVAASAATSDIEDPPPGRSLEIETPPDEVPGTTGAPTEEVTEESSGQESGSARSIRFSDWNAQ